MRRSISVATVITARPLGGALKAILEEAKRRSIQVEEIVLA
jgi:hypothetical protein